MHVLLSSLSLSPAHTQTQTQKHTWAMKVRLELSAWEAVKHSINKGQREAQAPAHAVPYLVAFHFVSSSDTEMM